MQESRDAVGSCHVNAGRLYFGLMTIQRVVHRSAEEPGKFLSMLLPHRHVIAGNLVNYQAALSDRFPSHFFVDPVLVFTDERDYAAGIRRGSIVIHDAPVGNRGSVQLSFGCPEILLRKPGSS